MIEDARPSGSTMLVRIFAVLMGILILLQGFLGGRGFFQDTGLLKTHEYVGEATFLVALIQVGVVFATLRGARDRNMLLGMSGLILVLTAIQLGLGFSAKDNGGGAAAWHIFNGVLLTGVIAAYDTTVFRLSAARR